MDEFSGECALLQFYGVAGLGRELTVIIFGEPGLGNSRGFLSNLGGKVLEVVSGADYGPAHDMRWDWSALGSDRSGPSPYARCRRPVLRWDDNR